MLSACQLRRQRRHEQPTADIAMSFLTRVWGPELPELWLPNYSVGKSSSTASRYASTI